MRFLVDENMNDRRRVARLRAQGLDPVLAADVGLLSAPIRAFAYAITHSLPVLTADADDFQGLHDLIMAAAGHHSGILAVRFDINPQHNLSDRAIGAVMEKLESSGAAIGDRVHVLNHWR